MGTEHKITSPVDARDTRVAGSAPAPEGTHTGPASAIAVPGLAHGGARLQAKLAVGHVDDPAEFEADRVADAVVAGLHPGHTSPAGDRVRREATPSTVAPEVGAAGGALSPALHSAITSARGGGSPLPTVLRSRMEDALGADLSAVRVHSGPKARTLAAGISARAFTVGSDVFFRDGLPDSTGPAGTHLLAHELAHVVQQNPGTMTRSTIRRNKESAELLTDLAEPQVFEGPEVKLQDAIVDRLEAGTPVLTKETDRKREIARAEFDKWSREFREKKHTEEEMAQFNVEWSKRNREITEKFPKFDSQELYLGSVVLTGIPPSADDDEKMISLAKLEMTDNAFKPGQNGFELSVATGVADAIVRNTLRTMIKAKQIEYLRKSGFVGNGWKIIVEVHYIRNRPSSAANFHKDTLGQTLFVNLNYHNKEDMAGPEYVINPPLVGSHEDKIEANMPGEFMADLKQTRIARGTPKEIKSAGTLKPKSVVAFVDEAIHHSTPLAGHRSVRIAKLKEFLAKEPPFKEKYAQALAAFTESTTAPTPTAPPPQAKSGGLLSSIFGSKKAPAPQQTAPPKTFGELFHGGSEQENVRWEALMRLCSKQDTDTVDRVALAELMDPEQIDALLSEYGPDTFNTVSIPGPARTNPEEGGRIPMRPDPSVDRKIPLTRQASRSDVKIAPVAVKSTEGPEAEGPKRTFFRTWVRVVRA